jgi:hypothetical protein
LRFNLEDDDGTMQTRPSTAPLTALAVALLAAATAFDPSTASAQTAPSNDASLTAKLIQLLIDKGVLTKDQAGALLSQAQSEAKAAARKPRSGASAAAPTAAGGPTPAAEATPPVPPGTVRVTYVPQIVRDQIAAEVRTQVMDQAKAEGWAAPNQVPEWAQRIKVYGDLRLRGQDDLFPNGNFDQFPDFNAIDQSSTGFDTVNGGLPPLLNTTEDRTRFRIRARLGVQADLDTWASANIRIATGNDNSPVTTNQTLGQNGNFSKYALWLDEAYFTLRPVDTLKIYAGREPNPFWTTNMLFDDNLNFDGVSGQGTYPVTDNFNIFGSGGAFPVFNTDFNFSSTQTVKFPSTNKYLFAGQIGGDWKINDDFRAKFATALFNYDGIKGEISAPCDFPYTACSTDLTRPQFQQFGNTVFAIRNLVPSTLTTSQPQFFGLASNFNVLDLHGRFDVTSFKPLVVSVEGDFIDNLAFSRSAIVNAPPGFGPVNNLSCTTAVPGNKCPGQVYQGGNIGWFAKIAVGTPEIAKLWDWNASIAYAYIESDATPDSFNSSDFHEGGTNAKGYILEGNLGIARNMWLSARYYGTNQVSGPTYANDIIQVDLNAKF